MFGGWEGGACFTEQDVRATLWDSLCGFPEAFRLDPYVLLSECKVTGFKLMLELIVWCTIFGCVFSCSGPHA